MTAGAALWVRSNQQWYLATKAQEQGAVFAVFTALPCPSLQQTSAARMPWAAFPSVNQGLWSKTPAHSTFQLGNAH